jgi:hypothetical protein
MHKRLLTRDLVQKYIGSYGRDYSDAQFFGDMSVIERSLFLLTDHKEEYIEMLRPFRLELNGRKF